MILGRYIGQPSLISQPHLCEECNKNQAAKIQELNSFEPTKEVSFSKIQFSYFQMKYAIQKQMIVRLLKRSHFGKKLIRGHGGGCSVDCNTAKT